MKQKQSILPLPSKFKNTEVKTSNYRTHSIDFMKNPSEIDRNKKNPQIVSSNTLNVSDLMVVDSTEKNRIVNPFTNIIVPPKNDGILKSAIKENIKNPNPNVISKSQVDAISKERQNKKLVSQNDASILPKRNEKLNYNNSKVEVLQNKQINLDSVQDTQNEKLSNLNASFAINDKPQKSNTSPEIAIQNAPSERIQEKIISTEEIKRIPVSSEANIVSNPKEILVPSEPIVTQSTREIPVSEPIVAQNTKETPISSEAIIAQSPREIPISEQSYVTQNLNEISNQKVINPEKKQVSEGVILPEVVKDQVAIKNSNIEYKNSPEINNTSNVSTLNTLETQQNELKKIGDSAIKIAKSPNSVQPENLNVANDYSIMPSYNSANDMLTKNSEESLVEIQNKINRNSEIISNPFVFGKKNMSNIENNSQNVYNVTSNLVKRAAMASNNSETREIPQSSNNMSGSVPASPNQGSMPTQSRSLGRHATLEEALVAAASLPLWRQKFNG